MNTVFSPDNMPSPQQDPRDFLDALRPAEAPLTCADALHILDRWCIKGPACVLLSGGEMTVTVRERGEHGGRGICAAL